MIQPDFFLTCGGHLRQKGYQTSSVMACSRKTCWRYASIATLEIFDLVQLMYVPLETLMQMLLQLLDILHYCINLVIPDYSSFHRRGTFDISKKPVSLHSTSSKKLIFVVYFIPAQNPVFPAVFSTLLHPKKTSCVFSQFPRHVPSVRQVTGGSFGSEFHDVHKFQIGKSVCKFDKLKIMFY